MTTMKSILSRLTQAVSGTDKELFNEKELNQFASFYLDKWDENTSEDVVAESFVDYWWNTDKACRRCSECGKLMREGYCADMGVALTFPLTLWVVRGSVEGLSPDTRTFVHVNTCRHVYVKPCTHEYVNTYIQKILYYVIENHYIRQS